MNKEWLRLCRQGAIIYVIFALVMNVAFFGTIASHGFGTAVMWFAGTELLFALAGAINWPIVVLLYRAVASLFQREPRP